MSDEQILKGITRILVDEFEIEEDIINPEATLYDELELDSLDGVDLIVMLENEFNFKVDRKQDEGTIRQMRTIQHIIEFIKQKIA